jgi:hypothetical protein
VPDPEVIQQRVYADNEDAIELRVAFANRRWTELTTYELFYHREMIMAFSGVGFRAYVAAYLLAALEDHERYAADLRAYLVYNLRPRSSDDHHVRTTQERLSQLDPVQRAVIGDVLRWLFDTGRMRDAGEVLADWK